jgi:hypothetical protein
MLNSWKHRYDEEIKMLIQNISALKEKLTSLKTAENERKIIFDERQKDIDNYTEFKRIRRLELEYIAQREKSTILLQVI